MCCLQLCSDAVDLHSDTITVDTLSRDRVDSVLRDSRSVAAQLKPDIMNSVLTSVVPEPQRDMLSRSAELTVTNAAHKQTAVANSVGVNSDVINIPSIVTPTSSAPLSTTAATSRASKISIPGQQRPKSLDQEFTLLNLDIPNVTIHSVCLGFLSLFLGTGID